jgi:D-threonate/D-erythronate kinase
MGFFLFTVDMFTCKLSRKQCGPTMQVLIIADDLTGALDSAVTLTGTGLRCVVARRPADVAAALRREPDVLAVSTASREGSAAAARAAVAAALDAIGRVPEIVFKKVDSRLKGHVAAEVAVFAERSGRARALVAPAIPAQGRTVSGGFLTGSGVAAPIDVAGAVAARGLALEVPDTRYDVDLDTALDRISNGTPALLVGAAGLAAAVARRLAPGGRAAVAMIRGPILLAIGSHDPITLAQIGRLAGRGDVTIDIAPDGACPAASEGEAGRVLRLVPSERRPFDAQAAGARFAAGVAQLVRSGGFGAVLACGGETADAILGALRQGVLDIEGEILPGVPVSSMVIGEQRLQLVTKSGGFGAEDALVSVVDAAMGGLEGAQ